MGFRSYIRHFCGRNSDAFPSFTAMVLSHPGASHLNRRSSRSRSSSSSRRREKVAENHPFLWVSEITLGTFWAQFCCLSVLHCHGVFPSGSCRLNRRSSRSRSSSSRRKKWLKSSFSMGFRSYIRHFFGRNSDAFPSFTAMVFSHPGAAI